MEVSYDNGVYTESKKRYEGRIILSEHKLYLRSKEGDIPSTYIPLEKIERLCKSGNGVDIFVRPSLAYQYTARIEGQKNNIHELIKDLVKQRGLRKLFLKNEWVEAEY